MSDLKPCPFCGGHARFEREHPIYEDRMFVGCDDCCVEVEPLNNSTYTRADQIALWNARPSLEMVSIPRGPAITDPEDFDECLACNSPSLEPPVSDELSGISGELPPASDVAGWRLVPVDLTEGMVIAAKVGPKGYVSLPLKDVWAALLLAAPQSPTAKTGSVHTAMMNAIRGDIVRQHPGAFIEDTDSEIVIPVGAVPANLYCKIDVSALAEAAMIAAAPPHPA